MAEDLGEILVTCSDERTFRVYDAKNGFKFLFDDSTKKLDPDFHTLTYLALESVKIIAIYRRGLILNRVVLDWLLYLLTVSSSFMT